MDSKEQVIKLENLPLSQIPWREYLANKNYDQDVENMCGACKKDQIKKWGEITIPCSGLATTPESLIKEFGHKFSAQDMELMEQIYDPYLWGKANLKPTYFKDRWYQEHVTRCTSKRMVSRMGRRTGKTFGYALKSVHRAFNSENLKILMIAPMETQVKEYIENVRAIVNNFNPEFCSPGTFEVGFRQKPYYEIRFSNGSYVRGIIAADDAKGVRGQPAHILIMDEVDYIPEAAITAAMGIVNDNPDLEIWVSSTPAGKKKLFELENSKQYKTFHFPSFATPHYNDLIEQELRTQYGYGMRYVHEVIGEYGDSELGVYQGVFIEKCKEHDLQLERADVIQNRGNYIVILGVDWNDDKVGTRLVSVAFDKTKRKFINADITRVSKEGWTQTEAIQRLIDLNRMYKYDKIYLDEGFGKSSVQVIKKYALDQFGRVDKNHPDLLLAEVKAVNFSSTIEIRDVQTQQMIKRDIKNYAIDNSVRYLERAAFRFDKVYDKELITQMENYEVIKRLASGRAVYQAADEKIGDHDLDAWVIALLAFNMEFTDIVGMIPASQMIYTQPREGGEAQTLFISGSEFAVVKSPAHTQQVPISQWQSSIFVSSKDANKSRTAADSEFYNKYVMNGPKASMGGITRKLSRSSFKSI